MTRAKITAKPVLPASKEKSKENEDQTNEKNPIQIPEKPLNQKAAEHAKIRLAEIFQKYFKTEIFKQIKPIKIANIEFGKYYFECAQGALTF
jgi:hypothetical protein